jgi:Ca-activated chloride channel family protein
MLVSSEVLPTNLQISAVVCLSRVSWPVKPFAILLGVFLLVTALQLTSIIVEAQTQIPDEDVVRVSTDLLLFPIRIRDKRGQAVQGLTEANLSLKDPNKVVSGLYFLPGADHIALLFALDRSGSLREIIGQQQDAALALFGRFNERSSIAVLRFAEKPSLAAAFTKDVSAAREAFRFSAAIDQRTAIFDAAKVAIDAFDALPRNRSERRIVILISDGLDTASTVKPSAVIQAAVAKRVSFYVIHLPLFEPRDGRLAVRTPAKGFRDLGEKTGGKYFLAGDVSAALAPQKKIDLAPVFQAIEEDLKSQYLLGFYVSQAARDGRRQSFSLTLVPPDIEYSVSGLGYSRTHKFVNVPGGTPTNPN